MTNDESSAVLVELAQTLGKRIAGFTASYEAKRFEMQMAEIRLQELRESCAAHEALVEELRQLQTHLKAKGVEVPEQAETAGPQRLRGHGPGQSGLEEARRAAGGADDGKPKDE
jgi:hypothetical protein